MRKLELTISSDYVPSWTIADAVRELFQNAIDHDGAPEWSYGAGTFSITSRNASLTPDTLLLGVTSKSSDPTAIGQYGEGYKLATLVMTREGKELSIHTGKEIWRARFVKSRRFNADVLTFFIEAAPRTDDLTITVSGITQGEWDEVIVPTNLALRDDVEEIAPGIINLPGKMFYRELHVCDHKDFKYGYNFQKLDLDRDRKIVSDFELKWTASKLWADTRGHDDEIIQMLIDDASDIEYLNNTVRSELCEKAYQDFIKRHGEGAIPISAGEEIPEHYKAVVVNSNYKHVLRRARSYVAPEPLPHPVEAWIQKYSYKLSPESIEELRSLI